MFLNYSSGEVIRKFGIRGTEREQVLDVIALCFSPDGKHILVSDHACLRLFTVEGAFVRDLIPDILHIGYYIDVLYSGTCIFALNKHDYVYVFSAETGEHIRVISVRVSVPAYHPSSFTAYKNQLFVLKTDNMLVFE